MLALHILISRSRESSIPSPAFPRAHLCLLAIEQERCDTVTWHIFHFQTLNLFFSMSLVSMPSLPTGHSFPITSAINRIFEDPPKVIAFLCGHLHGLAQDSTQSAVHPKVPSLGTQMHASAFIFSATILTTSSSASFFASQSLHVWFRGKKRSCEARKSWVESQLQHPNWALGLRTSYSSFPRLSSSNVKGGTMQSKWNDVYKMPSTQ